MRLAYAGRDDVQLPPKPQQRATERVQRGQQTNRAPHPADRSDA